MKKTFVYSALASAVIFAVNSAQAETQNMEELDEINVVGSVAKAGKVDYMTPRSIAVINDETLKNWELNQLDASLRYETGTLAQVYGADLDTNDWVKVRGMDSRLTIDGSAVYNTGYSHWSPNMYGVEAVEVVKGADSLTYGSAQSGGLINLITKRPTAEPKGEVNFKLGNRHERGLSADISDKAAENVRYRLVADYHKKQGELRGTWLESYYFAPSLTWDISNRTSLTLLASVQKDVGVPTTGFFPMQGTLQTNLGKIDRRTNLGDPTTDTLNRKQYSLGYEFTHKFDDSLTFSQNYKFNMQDVKQQSAFSNGVTVFPIIGQGAVFNDVITRSHSIDNRLTKNWKYDNYENSLTFGVDYQYLTAKGAYNSYYMPYSVPATFTPLYTLNSLSPIYNGIQVPNNARPDYDVTQRQLGFYLQDQVKIGNWHLSGGVRNDRAKGEEGSQSYKINHTSYSGGVMYVAENGLAPYFSYSESFVPETAQYKPTEGRQYEAGIKYLPSFIDGTFSLAYFDLKQDNAFTPSATGNAFQTKELKSKGIEIAANFKVAEKTAIVLGYTFNRVKDIRETGDVIRPALIPRHTASAQVTHQFLDNFIAGAAIRYIGTSSNGTSDNIKAPAKTLADIMLKYRINTNWELQANVSNLTDEKYVASCFYSTCYYGEGRRFSANLSYKW
ncbi:MULTISPECIES: TonB-dependent siderophore receptor [Rodentibacter]|uniref:TonB-dependent siderophore receptor n=1 Tax=Rodentibacter TaxID=1960084 RepID=UPI001CFEEC03|nr:TonB-dependent siderophore receptor [Rodentibacter sp. JRC1]GJI56841.1 ligand-gated channel [Rodentibacter sp. JRC1]